MARCAGERKIDYLALTLKEETSPERVFETLRVPMMEVPSGRFGYHKMALAETGGFSVLWDGSKPGMGVHVQISGKGCDETEHMKGFPGWQEWMNAWLESNARFTRLDLAIDDVSGRIPFDEVYGQVQSGLASTRAKNGAYQLKWDQEHRYQTLYVGRRGGEVMMRCYDKGLQLGQDKSWLRFEFEYRHAKADAVARLFVEKGWNETAGVARSFIEFKDRNHRTNNKSRQKPARWWVRLIGASKYRLSVPRDREASILRAYTWFKRQAAPMMATLTAHEAGDTSWMSELVAEGQTRMRKKHFLMLQEGLGI